MSVALPKTRYKTAGADAAHSSTARCERMRALPGVEAAGAVDDLPSQGGSVQPIVLEGHAELLPRDQPTVAVRKITPGYLRTMRIPLLRGRDVADERRRGAAGQPVGGQAAVGRRPIRSAAASRCRSSRRPSIDKRSSASSATSSRASWRTRRSPTRVRVHARARPGGTLTLVAAHARCRRRRSRRPRPASSARSIRSSRSRTSARWTRCSTRR